MSISVQPKRRDCALAEHDPAPGVASDCVRCDGRGYHTKASATFAGRTFRVNCLACCGTVVELAGGRPHPPFGAALIWRYPGRTLARIHSSGFRSRPLPIGRHSFVAADRGRRRPFDNPRDVGAVKAIVAQRSAGGIPDCREHRSLHPVEHGRPVDPRMSAASDEPMTRASGGPSAGWRARPRRGEPRPRPSRSGRRPGEPPPQLCRTRRMSGFSHVGLPAGRQMDRAYHADLEPTGSRISGA